MALADMPDGAEIFAESLKKRPVERIDHGNKKTTKRGGAADRVKKRKDSR